MLAGTEELACCSFVELACFFLDSVLLVFCPRLPCKLPSKKKIPRIAQWSSFWCLFTAVLRCVGLFVEAQRHKLASYFPQAANNCVRGPMEWPQTSALLLSDCLSALPCTGQTACLHWLDDWEPLRASGAMESSLRHRVSFRSSPFFFLSSSAFPSQFNSIQFKFALLACLYSVSIARAYREH